MSEAPGTHATSAPALRRRTMLLWLGGGAAVAATAGGLSLLPPPAPRARAEVGQLVAPGFAERASEVRLVMVTTSEEFYHLVLDPEGWVLTEKGRYLARADRMAALVRAVSGMRYARPMTRDPRKFDQLGLGDPQVGGTGALLEIGNGRGDSFTKLIVGYRGGTSYVRAPDDLQAWAVDGDAMPPLQRGARWLDLDIVSIPLERIREVEVRLAGVAAYRLASRDETGAQFVLAPPHSGRKLLASYGPALTAGALARFAPLDVAPEADVAPSGIAAEHVTRTRDGLEVRVRAWRSGVRGWVSLTASAAGNASTGVSAEAEALSLRAAGWAFALSDNDWGAIATPLDALVE